MKLKRNNQPRSRGQILVFVVFFMVILIGGGLAFSYVFVRTLRISGTLVNALVAFHAADSGLEHGLYNERVVPSQPQPAGCISVGSACYRIIRSESPLQVFLYATGTFQGVSRSLSTFFDK